MLFKANTPKRDFLSGAKVLLFAQTTKKNSKKKLNYCHKIIAL